METAILILLGLTHAFSLAACGHVLLTKRDPRAALGWTAALLFLPVGGLIIYLIFGIGRAQSRAEDIMRQLADISLSFVPAHSLVPLSALGSPEARLLNELGRRLSDVALCGGNLIEPLFNGDEAYPAMLDAINAAREHVFLGTYIFNSGHAANQFIAALTKAHERGVDVRVLVDGVGCLYSWHKPVKVLAERGIKTTIFRPLRLFPPSFGINLRNHRKSLVCDDVAFMGGMNISDGNLLNYEPHKRGKIQDMQFRCRGPIVRQIRRAFLMNWAFCTHEFTPLSPMESSPMGSCDCRIVIDGPSSELRFLYPTYFDSARVLIAEYVAEFFQTGMILFSELDIEHWEYIDHEIRVLILTESEVDTLLRVLKKVQKPDHDMCTRWKSEVDRNRWLEHIQEVRQVISKLK